MADYLAYRRSLSGVVMMVDARLAFTDLDQRLLDFIAQRVGTGEVKLLVLLTKADKLSRKEAQASLRAASDTLAAVATDGLPWIEIDYVADLTRARLEIEPAILTCDGAVPAR